MNNVEVIDDDDIFRIIEENFLRAGDILDIQIKRGNSVRGVKMILGISHK